MHQQIRTSPHAVDENIRRALEVLAKDGVNVEGIGPDFESPHARTVVPHEAFDAAMGALARAGFEPEARSACTFAIPHRPGQLHPILERVVRAGFEIDSVLVLASRLEGHTLVSVGVNGEMTIDQCQELGGITEPDGWIGGDFDAPSARAL